MSAQSSKARTKLCCICSRFRLCSFPQHPDIPTDECPQPQPYTAQHDDDVVIPVVPRGITHFAVCNVLNGWVGELKPTYTFTHESGERIVYIKGCSSGWNSDKYRTSLYKCIRPTGGYSEFRQLCLLTLVCGSGSAFVSAVPPKRRIKPREREIWLWGCNYAAQQRTLGFAGN